MFVQHLAHLVSLMLRISILSSSQFIFSSNNKYLQPLPIAIISKVIYHYFVNIIIIARLKIIAIIDTIINIFITDVVFLL